jgi:hypothetical protein
MNLCETCKHWEQMQPDHYNYDFNVEQFNDAGLVLADHGSCAMAENKSAFSRRALKPRDTLAWAEDAEDYFAGLRTHKTFGCVQWQAK